MGFVAHPRLALSKYVHLQEKSINVNINSTYGRSNVVRSSSILKFGKNVPDGGGFGGGFAGGGEPVLIIINHISNCVIKNMLRSISITNQI